MKKVLEKPTIIRILLLIFGSSIEIIGIWLKGTNNFVANILVFIGMIVFTLSILSHFISEAKNIKYIKK